MTFNELLKKLIKLLNENNVDFGYQRKNCKKNGHFKKKIINGISYYEIKIEKEDNEAAKIYTLIHELTHMLNGHLDDKALTNPQKEVVADQVGKHFIVKFKMIEELKNSKLNKKWDVQNYSQNWMNNRQISEKKSNIINEQIINAIDIINGYMEE